MRVATDTNRETSGRLVGLDLARALAVLAMVAGHTIDAVLSDAARAQPGMALYWHFRTFTAPMFLVVAGWVLVGSTARHGLTGKALVARYARRAALLVGWGLFLRWPSWNLPGLFSLDPFVIRHFLGFDALQCIGVSLMLLVTVLALAPRPSHRIIALVAMLVAIPAASLLVHQVLRGGPVLLAQALGGGDSTFPLFPWSGYVLSGALIALVLQGVQRPWLRALILLGAGGLLLAVTGVENPRLFSAVSARLFYWRLGPVLLILGLTLLAPRWLGNALAPIGRASLWVYLIHLPIAYGWGQWAGLATRIGRSFDATQALWTALAVVVFSVSAALMAQKLYRQLWPPRRPVYAPEMGTNALAQ